MNLLCDTSVLLRAADPSSAHHRPAERCLLKLTISGHKIVLAPQCLYEFWVVATRPAAVNGLGLTPPLCRRGVDALLRTYDLLPDPATLVHRWLDLVTVNGVSGKQAHDTRLVAFMLEHGITHVVTFNGPDFARYPGITVVDPRDAATYANL